MGDSMGADGQMSEAGVGERLRSIRRQKGLSLHDVEARSRMEFKASVLGAYERGERAISVPRLMRLAEVYDVPPDTLLPREAEVEIDLTEASIGQLPPTDEPPLTKAALKARNVGAVQWHPKILVGSESYDSTMATFEFDQEAYI